MSEVIMTGRWSEYHAGDLTEHVLSEDVADTDRLMAELGFSSLGAFTAAKLYGQVMGGYVCAQGDVCGLARADQQQRFTLEFRSSLVDGSMVITSTRADEQLRPASWLHFASFPTDSWAKLLAHHRQTLASMAAPSPLADLTAILNAIDALELKLAPPPESNKHELMLDW